ncbi:MAG: beta-galactosidase, partial [Cytophagaceae bacterium]
MPFLKHLPAALLLATALPAAAQTRQETLLTSDWKFTKGDQPDGAKPDFNDAKWQTVRIPHDWAISGPFDGKNDQQVVKIEQNGESNATLKSGRTGGLPFIGVGWYRRSLAVPALGKDGR